MKMDVFIKANMLVMKNMEMVLLFGLMEKNIKEAGLKGNNMVRGPSQIRKAKPNKVYGKMELELDGSLLMNVIRIKKSQVLRLRNIND